MTELKKELSRQDWVALHTSLLEEERKAEITAAQTQDEGVSLKLLETRGVVISRLIIRERSTGLYGRPLYIFISSKKDSVLPANKFSSGDIVGIHESSTTTQKQLSSGVVTRITQSSVQIVIDEGADELDCTSDDALFRLHQLANDVTYKRIKSSLEELNKETISRSSHLLSVLFRESPPKAIAPSTPPQLLQSNCEIQFFNQKLDSSQREAVEFSIRRSDLAVIHGPPGTGKTTTLVETIRQHIKLKSKILACAPSNLAVDNLVERLSATGVRVVRIGHPARVTPLTLKHTLDALLHHCEESELLKDIRNDISKELDKLKKTKDKGRRHAIRSEIKTYRKELQEREIRLTKHILTSCDVILATLTSSGKDGPLRHLPPDHIDLVVIDECSQAIEAACYQSILRATKLIIAGDHCQLPPTILSPEAASKGLELSLMERIIEQCGKDVVKMLTVQYRMNANIMNWASSALYDNKLVAHSSVADHLLAQSEVVQATEDTEHALVLIDTAGCDCWELNTPDEHSKGNKNEAVIVSCHVKNLIAAGVAECDIAVITPYNLQVELICSLLRDDHPKVEVRSVDGFQGREKEAVVMSLVRSNEEGKVGFLSENRRLNVAVTRARKHLSVVCDSDTVGRHDFLRGLIDYFSQHGLVKSAHEFQHDIEITDVQTPESVILLPNSGSRNKKKIEMDNRSDKPEPKPKQYKNEPHLPTEEENKKRRAEYEGIINRFVKSDNQMQAFPTNLNSFERRLIHDIASNLGLLHESQGEGKERFIVIKKPTEGELAGIKELNNSEDFSDDDDDSEENEAYRTEFKEIIQGFVDSDALTYKFPANLNGYERHIVYKLSDEFGLQHDSCGEGKKRSIVLHKNKSNIQKPNVRSSNNNKTLCSVERENNLKVIKNSNTITLSSSGAVPKSKVLCDDVNNASSTQVKMQTRFIDGRYQEVVIDNSKSNFCDEENKQPTKRCSLCGKAIPEQNFTVHTVQCERLQRARDEEKKRQKAKKKDKKSQNKGSDIAQGVDEDFDSVIAQFTKENNTCSQPKCKTPTSVIFQLCPFCRKTFCLAHHMAEIHGCGDQARHHARMMINKEGVLYPGSGIPSKKPPDDKRKQMQRKLDKKMEDLSSQRKAKKSTKNTKK
ncbi:DNA-binding protein SMUBP-2 [Halocaridina rubra]|uniref:DNA-binding protein SMUBP-2 n=1 Tax=Halocaridina rubra TaxID=373956 RepID=A0AAN8WMZ6_HALRR